MRPVLTIAAHALREALRRRVLTVIGGLTLIFGLLFTWGAVELFERVSTGGARSSLLLDERTVAGSTMLGLVMFGALFLGAVIAVFLTAGAVRGDAASGLVQPMLVRPLTRCHYLAGRFLAAATTAALYTVTTYVLAMIVIGIVGDWWPAMPLAVIVRIALAVCVVTAFSLLGSVLLGTTANGITVLMLYGAGIVGGLMGSIGEGIGSHRLEQIAAAISWLLPFEGLYRDGLAHQVPQIGGLAGALVQLGPLGSSHNSGQLMLLWGIVSIPLVLTAAWVLLCRSDL